jgi:hypothetical protein
MDKLIYDGDEQQCTNTATGSCPKFVLDSDKNIVSLIDKQGKRANMSIEHFNKFIRAVKSGEITELADPRKK